MMLGRIEFTRNPVPITYATNGSMIANALARLCSVRSFSGPATEVRDTDVYGQFAAGALALKSAVCETITIQRPPRLAIRKLAYPARYGQSVPSRFRAPVMVQ
jgi:hypothetical protein